MNAELASLKDELSQLKNAEPVRALFGAGWGCSRCRAVVDGGPGTLCSFVNIRSTAGDKSGDVYVLLWCFSLVRTSYVFSRRTVCAQVETVVKQMKSQMDKPDPFLAPDNEWTKPTESPLCTIL